MSWERAGALRVRLTPPAAARSGTIALGAASLVVGAAAVGEPRYVHELVALAVFVLFGTLASRDPRRGVLATLGALPFLALGRRLLLAFGPWHSADPMLAVGPLVALLVLRQTRSPGTRSRVSQLVIALIAIGAVESLNPLGGGLRPGVAGFVFTSAPLIWFFVGRNLADRRLAGRVLMCVVALAIPISIYGLLQSRHGMPWWDAAWIRVANYGSLQVGTALRGFGTFSSSAEYGTYVAIAALVVTAFALHRRVRWLAFVPLFAYAIFLSAIRGVLVISVAGVVVLTGMRARRPIPALGIAAVTGLAVFLASRAGFIALAHYAQSSADPLAQHQIGGLSHPLNPNQSSLLAHWSLFVSGLKSAIVTPLGLGTGSTNLAGARYGSVVDPTEVDLTNEFVSLGLLGGVVFLGIIVLTLAHVVALYMRRGDAVILAAIGALLAAIGQWLNPGYYAVAPLVWFLIGFIDREAAAAAERKGVRRRRAPRWRGLRAFPPG
ncbi:MAG: hypothetical protein ACYDCH_03060 [Gaiellaceae bacterium]